MREWLCLVLVASGCASAAHDDVGGHMPDAGRPPAKDADVPLPDAAPLPDAPPGQQQVTLSQTNDNTMAVAKAVACNASNGTSTLYTSDNSWYRVFTLGDYGITSAFQLQRVTFYSDWAYAGSGTSQPATLKIGTYSGTLDVDTLTTNSITPVTSKAITIPDADSTNGVDPPVITDFTNVMIPAGSNLIVELALPNGSTTGNIFFIGVSAGGETHNGYIRATPTGCGFTTPKSLTSASALNKPDNSIMLTVTGTKM